MSKYLVLSKFGLPQKIASQVSGIYIDSKAIKPGGVFFGIIGKRRKGEEFLEEVAQRGGIAAFVSEDYEGDSFGLELIKVKDTVATLQVAARVKMQGFLGKVIAITGSVGKTTTKDFLAKILSSQYQVEKTPRSFNTQITFPLNILNFSLDSEFFVLEMAMTQKGNIRRLCEIAPPDFAMITKIAFAHAENFRDLEEIAEAKAEIFSKEKTHTKIIDYELKDFPCMKGVKHLRTFSIKDMRADVYLDPIGGKIFEKGKLEKVLTLPFCEAHLLHDLLAAISMARQCGLTYEKISGAILKLQATSMRFEKIQIKGMQFINDAYNANPASVKAAIENFPFAKGKKIGVLGPMKELGRRSKEFHENVGEMAAKNLDDLYCIGEECKPMVKIFQKMKNKGKWFSTIEELVQELKKNLQKDDIVLVKASRAVELEKLFELI